MTGSFVFYARESARRKLRGIKNHNKKNQKVNTVIFSSFICNCFMD